MNRSIRIGTRDSQLALWQAHTVEKKLNSLGYKTKIIAIKSEGDLILDKPLYEMGLTGIFTKTLDLAMISGTIDIAVHSMKDVPTTLPKGIIQAAVLERTSVMDILVHRGNLNFLGEIGIVATGSLRRRAQWLHRYPQHTLVDLRGNVITRLEKFKTENWDGAVFAAAGLERINVKPENYIDLDWMIPAPAQGAMVAVAMKNDTFCLDALAKLNHEPTDICTYVERQFLKTLEGGCTAPIGAVASIEKNEIYLQGALFSIDGKEKININKRVSLNNFKDFGKICALEVLNEGGKAIMQKIKMNG